MLVVSWVSCRIMSFPFRNELFIMLLLPQTLMKDWPWWAISDQLLWCNYICVRNVIAINEFSIRKTRVQFVISIGRVQVSEKE